MYPAFCRQESKLPFSAVTLCGFPVSSQAHSMDCPEEMVTVFVPSSPTAFTGYVLVAPRKNVVELPLTVEEAMRLLVSGGVIVPETDLAHAIAAAAPIEVPERRAAG